MRIVKLDAIPSTNDFLKEMSRSQAVVNFTVVTAQTQTNGKGQRGSTWSSESGKNLIVSVYVDETTHFLNGIFSMNVAVAMSIFDTLNLLQLKSLAVKWPNDIMADNKKLGGILIENSLRSDGTFSSIIGIGLNINQTDFAHLPSATSVSNVLGFDVDIDNILEQLLITLQNRLSVDQNQIQLWDLYHQHLFRINLDSDFQTIDGKIFTGKIVGVDFSGRLIIDVEGNQQLFDLKDIKLLY